MLGNLYVAAKYWAWGYSDGMANAGASSSSSSKRRRKYVVDGQVYWAKPAEVPELLAAVLTKPEAAPKQLKKAAPAVRGAAPAPQQAELGTTLPAAPVVALEARFMALLKQFTLAGEAELLAGLERARAILDARDEEEVLLLLM